MRLESLISKAFAALPIFCCIEQAPSNNEKKETTQRPPKDLCINKFFSELFLQPPSLFTNLWLAAGKFNPL
jgi:hypothetical protein